MKRLLIAYFLFLLDLNVTVGVGRFGVLPVFVGYLILASGLKALAGESDRIDFVRPLTYGMVGYSAILWAMQQLGLLDAGSTAAVVFGCLGMTTLFYITWQVLRAFREIEMWNNVNLSCTESFAYWTILLVIMGAAFVSRFMPELKMLCVPLALTASVMFFAVLCKAQRAYEKLPPVS